MPKGCVNSFSMRVGGCQTAQNQLLQGCLAVQKLYVHIRDFRTALNPAALCDEWSNCTTQASELGGHCPQIQKT